MAMPLQHIGLENTVVFTPFPGAIMDKNWKVHVVGQSAEHMTQDIIGVDPCQGG